jgi:hypothetical protein
MKPFASRCAALPFVLIAVTAIAQVTASRYDNARTGATLDEKDSHPAERQCPTMPNDSASSAHSKLMTPVYAQPLFMPNVEFPGEGTHDVL